MYFEDFQIGQRFVSAARSVTAQDIKQFAAQFDPQPFHLDERLAADSFFNGLAASGWHTAAATMRLMVESVPIERGLIGVGGEISWPNPTRPGDQLQVTAEVVQITPSRSRPDRGIVLLHTETRAQDGRILQKFTAKLLIFRRSQSAAPAL